MQLPNGEVNAEQLRYLGDAIKPFGADGTPLLPSLLRMGCPQANVNYMALKRS